MTNQIEIRLAGSRARTTIDWLDSHHSFNFGPHNDPRNNGHGLLIVSNDDTVAPGGGFGRHPHRDMEIITWVLDGELEHRDSVGNEGVIYPGLAQRMSAGRGITHSEMNHSNSEPVHFVQMWVVPDTTGIEPGYEQLDVNAKLEAGGLIPVASGRDHDGTIAIHQAGAAMHVGRLSPGETVTLPDAPHVHVFVATGAITLAGNDLDTGDAARLTNINDLPLTATTQTEIIVWESDTTTNR